MRISAASRAPIDKTRAVLDARLSSDVVNVYGSPLGKLLAGAASKMFEEWVRLLADNFFWSEVLSGCPEEDRLIANEAASISR